MKLSGGASGVEAEAPLLKSIYACRMKFARDERGGKLRDIRIYNACARERRRLRRDTLASIRFGTGLSEEWTDPSGTSDMVSAAQRAAAIPPRLPRADRISVYRGFREAKRAEKAGERASMSGPMALRHLVTDDLREAIVRATVGNGFGERLTLFWADHFTVAANGPFLSAFVADFIETAVRPNIAGRFADMLSAVARHPAMLAYLNQSESFGPNSRAGRNRRRGLNENYARELLELHTLGVGPIYRQHDVRALALLLTGLSYNQSGFIYRTAMAEPGPHDVLGRQYGDGLDDIEAVLHDLALHPETARHLSRKLIIHFLGQEPEQDLVDRMSAAYLASGGALSELYAALLDDPRAWAPELRKVKPPFDFIVSALRAANLSRDTLSSLNDREVRVGLTRPMLTMGQPPFRPNGPDGWSEKPEGWITPPTLAARLRWASGFAERIAEGMDPRAFLGSALADAASPLLSFAVAGAENRVEGVAFTLISPEFNRR